jgi:PST family polysaccharide transporter
MDTEQLNRKIISAAKWSTIAEILSRLVFPISQMILARILAPDAFGVIATVTMIVSFADMFTDAGFQKYLVQHEFNSIVDKYKSANVAFWTNFVLSLFLWIILVLFNQQVSFIVGNPGLGVVIIVSCIQLPLTAFSSIQIALFRRDFDFKTLFIMRLVSIFIPFIITIPLALIGFNYWSLIISTIFTQIFNAVFLTIKSPWKPQWFYDFRVLKKMLSFSIWSLIESVSIWFTVWVDTFIVGYFLNEYYLGIYKTSTSMVNGLLGMVTAATTPVLFSALSRLQHNERQFNQLFYKFQRIVALLLLPLGIGAFLYSDLATKILLGNQWEEASSVIGIWALTSIIMIVYSHYCSEVYRAKGRPKLSFIAQVLHLIFLVPICLLSARYGFWIFVIARSISRLQMIIVQWIIMFFIIKISILKSFRNLLPVSIATIAMGLLGFLLQTINESVIWSAVSIIICIIFYICALVIIPNTRMDLFSLSSKIIPRNLHTIER